MRYPNTLKWVKKNLVLPSFFNPLCGIWFSDETLFLVFDILHHDKHKEELFHQGIQTLKSEVFRDLMKSFRRLYTYVASQTDHYIQRKQRNKIAKIYAK